MKGLTGRLARVATLLLLILISHAVVAQEQRVIVIANVSVTTTELNSNQLRKIFSMRQTTWPDGQQITVFVLPAKSKAHTKLCKDILKMFPYQIERLWNKLAYSGLGEAPIEVDSPEDMKSKIENTPGAVGYILSSMDDLDDSAIQIIGAE